MGRAADLKSRLWKSRRGTWARTSQAWYFNIGVKTSLGAQARMSCGGGCRAGRHGCFPYLTAGGQLPPRMLKTPDSTYLAGAFQKCSHKEPEKGRSQENALNWVSALRKQKILEKINFPKRMRTGVQWVAEGWAQPCTPIVPAAGRLRKKTTQALCLLNFQEV